MNTARQIGFALGVAVLGCVFSSVAGSSRPTVRADFVAGLDAAMAVAGGVGLLAGAAAIALFSRSVRSSEGAATAVEVTV